MKKYLITQQGNFYKANLHCHSTMSDGHWTPEEMKQKYMDKGYSIVAFTDHNIFLSHNDLTDENFLALNGFEADVGEYNPDIVNDKRKCCHLCFIALDKDKREHPFWHRKKYMWGNIMQHLDEAVFDPTQPDFEREYSTEGINEMTRRGQENGFFVTYNHPMWSQENYSNYSKYENLDAMEIYNNSCSEGFYEYNPGVYDDMLRTGKKIGCIATDDNHNWYPDWHIRCDSFGGFTYIKSKSLNYEDVATALKNGQYYASRGPQITELWYDDEDQTVTIKCSDAERVVYNTGVRRYQVVVAGDIGVEHVTEAKFQVKEDEDYFRLTVFDDNGMPANTRAYFLEDFM